MNGSTKGGKESAARSANLGGCKGRAANEDRRQTKRTRMRCGAKSRCTMYEGGKIALWGDFSLFICIYAKKSVPLHKICNQTYERNQYKETFGDHY